MTNPLDDIIISNPGNHFCLFILHTSVADNYSEAKELDR